MSKSDIIIKITDILNDEIHDSSFEKIADIIKFNQLSVSELEEVRIEIVNLTKKLDKRKKDILDEILLLNNNNKAHKQYILKSIK